MTQVVLMLSVSIAVAPQISFGGSQSNAAAVQGDRSAEVNALIRELRDPRFAIREAATQKLTEIGKPAVAALKLAVESDSLEVRVRAKSILSGIRLDRSSSFRADEQAIIKQFMAADVLSRVAILRAQATNRNTTLFLRLLDIALADEERAVVSEGDADSPVNEVKISSAIEELIASEADNPLTQWVANALVTQRWDDIHKLLTHPGILKYSPMLRVSEARNMGELKSYIEGLFQAFSNAQADGKTLSSRELVSLIGLLRVQRDFERVEEVIAVLPDVDLQRRIRRDLVFQRGDWAEVLRRTKLGLDAPEFISANPLQRGFLQYLLGDQAAVASVEKELRQQLQAAIEAAGEENAGPVKLIESQLRIFGAVTLNWPLLKEFLETDNLADNVELLVALNRPVEALELLKIGPSFKDRQAWVNGTLKELSDAHKELKKKARGRRDDDYNRLTKLISDKEQILNTVVDIVEQWGLDGEAQLYYQVIFSVTASANSRAREDVMERLVQLGRKDEYWQLVGSLLRGREQRRYAGRTWFGITNSGIQSYANLWSTRIRGEIVDPVEQAKTIAAIMNSPWLDREGMDFDLEYELARFRSRSTMNATGGDEYLMGRVLELHGQDEAADALVKQAAKLGHSSAIRARFFEAMANEDLFGILEHWSGGSSGTADTCLIAEEAALKILETETDPEKIKLAKEQLAICQLAIAAQWTGGSHWARRSVSQLGEMGKSHLAILRLQCLVYGVPGDFVHKDGQHRQLGDALVAEGSDLKYQGASELATIMFDELSYATAAQTDIGWSYSATNLNIAFGKGLIERKEYDRAADFLVRTAEFSPGDVSAGEGTIRVLDEEGATEAADRVYRSIAKHFVETLEEYPDSPLARNNFAWLSAVSHRDLESARRHVSVAVKVRPHVEQYWDSFAEIEFLLGHPKEAFEFSKRCIQLNPSRLYYRRQKERFRRAMGESE